MVRLDRPCLSFDRDVHGEPSGTHSFRRAQRSFDRMTHGNVRAPHPVERHDVSTSRHALSPGSPALSFDPVARPVIRVTLPDVRHPLSYPRMCDGLRRAHRPVKRACVSVIRTSRRLVREPLPRHPVDGSAVRVTVADVPEHGSVDPVDARTLPVTGSRNPVTRSRERERDSNGREPRSSPTTSRRIDCTSTAMPSSCRSNRRRPTSPRRPSTPNLRRRLHRPNPPHGRPRDRRRGRTSGGS
jgi:hypothetical protein